MTGHAAPLDEVPNVSHEMALVCTDRGQHARQRILTVEWWQRPGAEEPDYYRLPVYGRKYAHEPGRPWVFWCGKCSRTPQVNEARWDALMGAAWRERRPSFDMSYLD